MPRSATMPILNFMIISRSIKPALLAFLTVGFMLVAEPAWANCLSGSEARAAVQSGQAQPLRNVAGGLGGEVVKAQLCRRGGRLVYEVGVLQSNGQVARRVVDARSGQVLR